MGYEEERHSAEYAKFMQEQFDYEQEMEHRYQECCVFVDENPGCAAIFGMLAFLEKVGLRDVSKYSDGISQSITLFNSHVWSKNYVTL